MTSPESNPSLGPDQNINNFIFNKIQALKISLKGESGSAEDLIKKAEEEQDKLKKIFFETYFKNKGLSIKTNPVRVYQLRFLPSEVTSESANQALKECQDYFSDIEKKVKEVLQAVLEEKDKNEAIDDDVDDFLDSLLDDDVDDFFDSLPDDDESVQSPSPPASPPPVSSPPASPPPSSSSPAKSSSTSFSLSELERIASDLKQGPPSSVPNLNETHEANVKYGKISDILTDSLGKALDKIMTVYGMGESGQWSDAMEKRLHNEERLNKSELHNKFISLLEPVNFLVTTGMFKKGEGIDLDRLAINPEKMLAGNSVTFQDQFFRTQYDIFKNTEIYRRAISPLIEIAKHTMGQKASEWYVGGTDLSTGGELFETIILWFKDPSKIDIEITERTRNYPITKNILSDKKKLALLLDPLDKFIFAFLRVDPTNRVEFNKWKEICSNLQKFLLEVEQLEDNQSYEKVLKLVAQADCALNDFKNEISIKIYGMSHTAFRTVQGIVKLGKEQPMGLLAKIAYKVAKSKDKGRYASSLVWIQMPSDLMRAQVKTPEEVETREKRIVNFINHIFKNKGKASEALLKRRWKPSSWSSSFFHISEYFEMISQENPGISFSNYLTSFNTLNSLQELASTCWSQSKEDHFEKLSDINFETDFLSLVTRVQSQGAAAFAFIANVPDSDIKKPEIYSQIVAIIDNYLIYLLAQIKSENGLKAKLPFIGNREYKHRYELAVNLIDKTMGEYSSFNAWYVADKDSYDRAKQACEGQLERVKKSLDSAKVKDSKYKSNLTRYKILQESMQRYDEGSLQDQLNKLQSINNPNPEVVFKIKVLQDKISSLPNETAAFEVNMRDMFIDTARDKSFMKTPSLNPVEDLSTNVKALQIEGNKISATHEPEGLDDEIKWPYPNTSDQAVTETEKNDDGPK